MAIAGSAPVLPNQKKKVLQNRPIYWRTLYNPENHCIKCHFCEIFKFYFLHWFLHLMFLLCLGVHGDSSSFSSGVESCIAHTRIVNIYSWPSEYLWSLCITQIVDKAETLFTETEEQNI
jgi:hypothetical protein